MKCLIFLFLFLSCFDFGVVGFVISICCAAVFHDAIVSSMVCIITMEYHLWWIYWLLAVCARIDGKKSLNSTGSLDLFHKIPLILFHVSGYFKSRVNRIR